MGYAYFVSDANTVKVDAAVFTMSYTYESMLLAFPALGTEPNCHLGVMVTPSILSTDAKYGVVPLVFRKTTVIASPMAMKVFSVTVEEARRFSVIAPVATDV
jgi:hypothetical protein